MVPSVEVIVAPVRFISGQKFETGEAPVDGRPAAVDERTDHRGDDGVVVEQRERGPHHVVGGPTPADADLRAQRTVVGVAQHAALRRSGGATRVHEGGQVLGSHVGPLPGPARRHDVVPTERAGRHRGRVVAAHDHEGRQLGQVREHLDRPVDEVGFHDQRSGPGVGQLVAEVGALVGRVHRDGDRARVHDAPPGQHRLGPVLHERRHAITGTHAQRGQARGEACRRVAHRGGAERVAAHVEVRPVGVDVEPRLQQVEHGPELVVVPPGHGASLPPRGR